MYYFFKRVLNVKKTNNLILAVNLQYFKYSALRKQFGQSSKTTEVR